VGELAFDRRGSGEPLVLLHGLGSRRRAFDPVVELAASERELVALDLPGFGESPPDEAGTALRISDFADRVERFFAEQGLQRPHLAGNSLGAGIGLELGRRGALRSLTAISPVGFWGRPGQAWCRGALRAGYKAGAKGPESIPTRLDLVTLRLASAVFAFGQPLKAPAEEVLATREAGLQAPGFLDACTYGLDYSFGDPGRLREIPLTIAWGRRDLLLFYWTQAREARRRLPWARHLALPGCGHVPFHDDPQLLARVLIEGSS
jgi:pimeloyl-ACP methyl ester carboxylesterase